MEKSLARDVQLKLQKLSEYAQEGKWHNVLEFAGHFKAAAAAAAAAVAVKDRPIQLQQPQPGAAILHQRQQLDAELAFATFKVHALMRLRKFAAAGDELAQLGQVWGLPAQQQQQQQAAACVPFGLLYLRAQLPACQGLDSLTLDLLHELRCYCQQQLQLACEQLQEQQQVLERAGATKQQQQQQQQQQQAMQEDASYYQQDQKQQASAAGSSSAAAAAAVELWQHRLHGVTCSLVLHYWQAGAVATALHLLDEQLLLQPCDHQLWSLAGRLYLQLNVLKQAHRCFSRVQQLVQEQQQQQGAAAAAAATSALVRLQRLVHHNWGCFHALTNNMTAALHEFDAAQQLAAAAEVHGSGEVASGPASAGAAAAGGGAKQALQVDGVALANSAVCLLHMGQLTEAISCVEAGLQQHPAEVAQECTLSNLGVMFDLAYSSSSAQQARRHIASSLMRCVPHDFDLAVMAPEHAAGPLGS